MIKVSKDDVFLFKDIAVLYIAGLLVVLNSRNILDDKVHFYQSNSIDIRHSSRKIPRKTDSE